MDRSELEGLDRESLVVRAERAGIRRARILTRPELIDELLRLDPNTDREKLERSRGFFGRARDLLARVVERGLHLPDAADRIRSITGGPLPPTVPRSDPQAVPTVTLAEIYAAQGHKGRAIETLRRVLEREPDHAPAQALLARLTDASYVAPPPAMPPELENEPDIMADPDRPPPTEDPATRRMGRSSPPAEESGAQLGDPEIAFATTSESFPHTPDVEIGSPGSSREDDPAFANTAPPSRAPKSREDFSFAHTAAATPYARAAREDDPAFANTAPPSRAATADRPEGVACVAVPIGVGAVYVWWRGTDDVEGEIIVRVAVIIPTWDGPRREIRDVAAHASSGGIGIRGLPEHAVARVAIGRMHDGAFTPIAHSPAIEAESRRGLVRWTIDGHVPLALDDPRIASAVEAARRA